jgi:hypothetical protein
MYDSELVIRAGALSALKRLCLEAGVWSGVRASKSLNDEGYVRTMYHTLLSYLLLLILVVVQWSVGQCSMMWCTIRITCQFLLQKPLSSDQTQTRANPRILV